MDTISFLERDSLRQYSLNKATLKNQITHVISDLRMKSPLCCFQILKFFEKLNQQLVKISLTKEIAKSECSIKLFYQSVVITITDFVG